MQSAVSSTMPRGYPSLTYVRDELAKWFLNVKNIKSLKLYSPARHLSCQFSEFALQWRHTVRDGVSNLQPHGCLLTVYSGADQRKHQSSASLVFVRRIHRWPMNFPQKGLVTRKMLPFDDAIMVMMNKKIFSSSLLSCSNYKWIIRLVAQL